MTYDPNNDPVLILTLLAFGIAVGWLASMLINAFRAKLTRWRKFKEFVSKK